MVRCILVLLVAVPLTAQSLTLRTLAGSHSGGGYADGRGEWARFSAPAAVAADTGGNLYVADTANHTIRRIGADGTVTTVAGVPGLAGFADGAGAAAQFRFPAGIAVDPATGAILIADGGNHVIRRMTPGGAVTTVAGAAGVAGAVNGSAAKARFASPRGLDVDAAGNVYIADTDNHAIRRLAADGTVTTYAGTMGMPGEAEGKPGTFNFPHDVAVDEGRGVVYVADDFNYRIRKVASDGTVSILAGEQRGFRNGFGRQARFERPASVDVDGNGTLYVTDMGNCAVRQITPTGQVSTLAGKGDGSAGTADGIGEAARFQQPEGIAVGTDGAVYVTDRQNHAIRRIAIADGAVTTFAGAKPEPGIADGKGPAARFFYPNGVAVDGAGNTYVLHGSRISKVTLDGTATQFARMESGDATSIAAAPDGSLYVAVWSLGTVRRITPDGVVTTVAGREGEQGHVDGPAGTALFYALWGIAVDSHGVVYVADLGNSAIRRITPDGTVSTLAGGTWGFADGTGAAARFSNPAALAVDGAGNVYVADYANFAIRRITAEGVVTTIAGPDSGLRYPTGIAADAEGNLFVTDERHVIYRIAKNQTMEVEAGVLDAPGNVNGAGPLARLSSPAQLALAPNGSLVIADQLNHAVRIAAPPRRRTVRR